MAKYLHLSQTLRIMKEIAIVTLKTTLRQMYATRNHPLKSRYSRLETQSVKVKSGYAAPSTMSSFTISMTLNAWDW